MEDNPTTIEKLLEKAENYTRTHIELAKLQLVDKCADVASSLISLIAIAIVVGMFLMLTNLGLALWIGEMLGNVYYGFFSMAAFYLIVALLFMFFKKPLLKTPVSNIIITQILKEKVR